MSEKTCKDCKNFETVCKYALPSTSAYACINFENKNTVFHRITANEEALADKLVYYIEGKHSPFGRRWKSTLTGDVCYVNRSSALEATIEELKKEER